MAIWRVFSIITLNVWFYFWFPVVLGVSVVLGTAELLVLRIFHPAAVRRVLRFKVNRYGRAVTRTAWPWIRVEVLNAPRVSEAPFAIVENHSSSFDPFVQGVLPYELVQAARGWALKLPVLGIVGRLAGYLDVDSLSGDELVERAAELLNSGVSVVFFPEGTRRPEGDLGPFHGAAFRAAAKAEVPIVPAVVTGIADKPRKGSLVMRPGKITIRFLPAIPPDEHMSENVATLKKTVRKAMLEALSEK
jgi:1-acyl-sn-glycerol-3-phosphate acyltransferase